MPYLRKTRAGNFAGGKTGEDNWKRVIVKVGQRVVGPQWKYGGGLGFIPLLKPAGRPLFAIEEAPYISPVLAPGLC
ncbi:unnamed protein product [Allacma fusca]|uniref:Uncharacterized protein n=1 Tax=Allacma fusca TaxID=39272 RepID=A0A8J2PF40_9HEXA|nr:unnamed protein product [Allacma fusca]